MFYDTLAYYHGFQLSYIQVLDGLNIYNILEPCYHANNSNKMNENTKLPLSFRKLGETERPLPVRTRIFGRAWPFKAPVKPGYVPTWPEILESTQAVPCIVSRSKKMSRLYMGAIWVFGY